MAYQVVCVEIDESSDQNDCRCISLIGFFKEKFADVKLKLSEEPRKQTPEDIHKRIDNGDEFFIKVDGKKTPLEEAEKDGTLYVRSEPNDTEDDNLLKQEPC